jgi:hypothetical protein
MAKVVAMKGPRGKAVKVSPKTPPPFMANTANAKAPPFVRKGSKGK